MNFIKNHSIELVIFDMDGLMFDSERIYVETWPDAARLFGYEVTEEAVVGAIGLNAEAGRAHFEGLYGKAFPFYEIREARLKSATSLIEKKGLPIKQGLYNILNVLKEKNIKKAIATSSERKRADWYLELSHLEGVFDAIVCGDEIENSKPNPEIFIKAAKKINTEPKHCIVLEDSESGIRAAHSAGMYPFMVPDYKQPSEELKSLTAGIFKSLDAVADIL
ncbi:MAG: HAD-superfamily hydrolase, subfamily variant 3 [Clostridia bacterium]|nr:HAD-superfamily hydrolase, subfamily variant 3 [Clostridia bacterium]